MVTTKVSSKSEPTPPSNTEVFFENILEVNTPIAKKVIAAKPRHDIKNSKDLAKHEVSTKEFAKHVFQHFAERLDLFTYSNNSPVNFNFPTGTTDIQKSKIKVALGIGSPEDKIAVYNTFVPSLKTFTNPSNNENISELNFDLPRIRLSLINSLPAAQKEYASLYAQAQKMANSIASLADRNGNYEFAVNGIAPIDGDVELTPENMQFVARYLYDSGLTDINNPSQLQNWLVYQNQMNAYYKKNAAGQPNTVSNRVFSKYDDLGAEISDDKLKAMSNNIGVVRPQKPNQVKNAASQTKNIPSEGVPRRDMDDYRRLYS